MSELRRLPDNPLPPSTSPTPDYTTLDPGHTAEGTAGAGTPPGEEILAFNLPNPETGEVNPARNPPNPEIGEVISVELTRKDFQVLLDVSVGAKWNFEISPAELRKARQDCYDIARRGLDAARPGHVHVRATEQQIDVVLEALSVAVRQLGPDIVLDAVSRLRASAEYQAKLTKIADSYSPPRRGLGSPLAAFRIGIGILLAAGIILPFVGDASSQVAFQNAVQDGTLTAALVPLIRR